MNDGSDTPVRSASGEAPGGGPASAPGPAAPVEAVDLRKSFQQADGSELHVLEGVDLRVQPGEAVAVVGAIGAGQSTLLHLLGALDRPTAGMVRIGGQSPADLDEAGRAALRSRNIGFVFQFHHLLREFTAQENVMMPCLVAGVEEEAARDRAFELLAQVGLGERLEHRPSELSGGEQQRVAIARALAHEPMLILADEPTGNLDYETGRSILKILNGLVREHGRTIILAIHYRVLSTFADGVLELKGGKLHNV
jgi:predicted ABC-type transport system involved in lysophospholipase L1 biosynthesis ATPase subunit